MQSGSNPKIYKNMGCRDMHPWQMTEEKDFNTVIF